VFDLPPPAEPYERGMLDAGDGQRLYWEECGDPAGKPAVVLHGGPGSGCAPWMRLLFDPKAYRVVLVDQRGAGRSLPNAGDLDADLSVNTTAHLLADIERLREHRGIERWLVLGMSWGSTLGLAYAQQHPEGVSEVVLMAVTNPRRSDVEWITRGVGRFLPREWEAFRDGVPAAERDGNLAAAYARLLASPDAEVRAQAARDWCDWEAALVSLDPNGGAGERFADPDFRFAFARVVTHYFANAAFLEDDQLLRDAHRLAGIPAVLIHGRLDLGGPLEIAWQLHRAWPGSELVVLDGSGHISMDMGRAAAEAIHRFAPAAGG